MIPIFLQSKLEDASPGIHPRSAKSPCPMPTAANLPTVKYKDTQALSLVIALSSNTNISIPPMAFLTFTEAKVGSAPPIVQSNPFPNETTLPMSVEHEDQE